MIFCYYYYCVKSDVTRLDSVTGILWQGLCDREKIVICIVSPTLVLNWVKPLEYGEKEFLKTTS